MVTAIAQLSAIHAARPALQHGSYKQLYVASQQLAFARQSEDQLIVVVINAADQPVSLNIKISIQQTCQLRDLMAHGKSFAAVNGAVKIPAVPANWARILLVE